MTQDEQTKRKIIKLTRAFKILQQGVDANEIGKAADSMTKQNKSSHDIEHQKLKVADGFDTEQHQSLRAIQIIAGVGSARRLEHYPSTKAIFTKLAESVEEPLTSLQEFQKRPDVDANTAREVGKAINALKRIDAIKLETIRL